MRSRLLSVLSNPYKLLYSLGSRGYLKFFSDKFFLKIMYKARMDKKLNLDNATTFNEKLQWLKLNDRNPLYSKLVDKYLVRDFINDKIGKEYLIPLLGVWDNFEDINFSKLPNQFVLKTTHDSGGVVICKDKLNFDIKEAEYIIKKSMKNNYYNANREWVYKNLKPRIIAEKFMAKKNGEGLDDYKFFCFNGEAKMLNIISNREREVRKDFLDLDFNKIPVTQTYPASNKIFEKPENYNLMVDIAEEISKNIPHVRVDLYNDEGKIYFGELTFFNASGATKFEPEKYDEIFGDWIDLSIVQDRRDSD